MVRCSLSECVVGILKTRDAQAKATEARSVVSKWRANVIKSIGRCAPPDRPARPNRPELMSPRFMPKRGRAQTEQGRIALLHAVAHIELNAIDLAADILVRFPDAAPPLTFYDDWLGVLDDEARHFLLLSERLCSLGIDYGHLPAHDGLWQSAQDTVHDLLARLAVVPLVLEARGLDVTPGMIESLRKSGDTESGAILELIYTEEIGHVAVGRKWFEFFCTEKPEQTWRALVAENFNGKVKPPFNDKARAEAGFGSGYYKNI